MPGCDLAVTAGMAMTGAGTIGGAAAGTTIMGTAEMSLGAR